MQGQEGHPAQKKRKGYAYQVRLRALRKDSLISEHPVHIPDRKYVDKTSKSIKERNTML